MYKGIFIFIGVVCFTDYGQFPLLMSILCCQIPTNFNEQKKDKNIVQGTIEQKDIQDYIDGSILQFIKFDFLISCWKSKLFIT